jgi:hypothetical protein
MALPFLLILSTGNPFLSAYNNPEDLQVKEILFFLLTTSCNPYFSKIQFYAIKQPVIIKKQLFLT